MTWVAAKKYCYGLSVPSKTYSKSCPDTAIQCGSFLPFPSSFGETGKDRSFGADLPIGRPARATEAKGSSQGPEIFRPFLAGKIWVEDPLGRSEHGGTLMKV